MAQSIKGYQCQECGHRSPLASAYCRNCSSQGSYSPVEVIGKGKIFSYTIVHVSEEKFSAEVPYPLILVELDKDMRVLGRLQKESMDRLKIGSAVELTEYRDGVPVFK